MVLDSAAPMRSILSKLWDDPRRRAELVIMWRQAQDEIEKVDDTRRWRNVRGAVGAFMAHVLRTGGALPRPLPLSLSGYDVDLLKTPPKQVEVIIRRQARQHLDIEFLKRSSMEYGWDLHEVLQHYPYGIDWELVRRVL